MIRHDTEVRVTARAATESYCTPRACVDIDATFPPGHEADALRLLEAAYADARAALELRRG